MLEHKTASMCGSSDYCRGWNDAVAEIPKWISVKERLPPETKVSDKNSYSALYLVALQSVDSALKSVQMDMTRNGKWLNYGLAVTHWMPLPDAPEVDDE